MFKWSIVFLTSHENTLENFLDIILIEWSSFSTYSLNKDIYSLTLESEFLYSITGLFGNKRFESIDSDESPKFLFIFNSEKLILWILSFSIWFFIYNVFIQFVYVIKWKKIICQICEKKFFTFQGYFKTFSQSSNLIIHFERYYNQKIID